MLHVIALATTALWVAANFYLWALKQDQFALFWESLGMAAIGFPALLWYVTREPR